MRSDPVTKAVSSSDQVYHRLRTAVLSRQVLPGTRLIETEIARELGVSRTPVREALRRLESDGFVERGAAGGLFARPVDSREIKDIFLIRQALDRLAAGLAAERGKPQDWTELRYRLGALAAAIDEHGPCSAEFLEVHFSFHRTIYDIAFSPRLARAIENHILIQLEVAAELSYSDPTVTAPVIGQHEQLIQALENGNAAGAVVAIDEHTARSEADAKRSNPWACGALAAEEPAASLVSTSRRPQVTPPRPEH